MNHDALTLATWRKSSFSATSGGTQDCVEVATLGDGRIAMRDSKHPEAGALFFTRTEMVVFLNSIKQHEFDDLTG